MSLTKFSREQFNSFYKQINGPSNANLDFLYEVFCDAIENAEAMTEAKVLGKAYAINPIVILLYLVNEYNYLFLVKKAEENNETESKNTGTESESGFISLEEYDAIFPQRQWEEFDVEKQLAEVLKEKARRGGM